MSYKLAYKVVPRHCRFPRMSCCAFTDASSTQYGTCKSDCRGSRKPKVQILCGFCEPGVDVSRCSSCFQKFARTLAKRREALEKKTKGTVVMHSALAALFTGGFDELARTGAPGKLDKYLVKVSDGVWRWREPCACCYTFTVPEVEACMPDGFASMAPRIRTDVVDFATRQLEHPSGLISPLPVDVRVEVVRCQPVISDRESKEVKFRAVDPPEHDGYACFWKPPPPHPDGRAVDGQPTHMCMYTAVVLTNPMTNTAQAGTLAAAHV